MWLLSLDLKIPSWMVFRHHCILVMLGILLYLELHTPLVIFKNNIIRLSSFHWARASHTMSSFIMRAIIRLLLSFSRVFLLFQIIKETFVVAYSFLKAASCFSGNPRWDMSFLSLAFRWLYSYCLRKQKWPAFTHSTVIWKVIFLF